MRRTALLLGLTLLLAGCLGETELDSARDPDRGGSDTAAAGDAAALGRLYLHFDGTRTWMDGTQRDDLPGPALTAATTGTTYSFPLEPALAQDVETQGIALLTLRTSNSINIVGGGPVFTATLLIDGQAVGSASVRGSGKSLALDIPATIPAGSDINLEVCVCGGLQDLQFHVFEPGASTMDVPGPTGMGGIDGALPFGVPEVQQQGGRWIATRTDVAAGDAPEAYRSIGLATINGGVLLERMGDDHFVLEAQLFAYGDTRQQALDRLALVYVVMDNDRPTDLDAEVRTMDTAQNRWSGAGGSLHLKVPGAIVDDTTLKSTNGNVVVSGLGFGTLEAHTTNGNIQVGASRADSIQAGSTNGDLTFVLDRPTASGKYDLDTTNGGIELRLSQSSDNGVDAHGRTTNGEVEFTFPGTQDVQQPTAREKHVRTEGYNGKAVQTKLELRSTNGSIQAGTR